MKTICLNGWRPVGPRDPRPASASQQAAGRAKRLCRQARAVQNAVDRVQLHRTNITTPSQLLIIQLTSSTPHPASPPSLKTQAKMFTRAALTSAVAVLLASTQVDAHGHLIEPSVSFGSNKAMMSSFAGRFPEPNSLFTGAAFPDSGTKGNYEEFMKHFKAGSQSLKEIILANNKPLPGATKDCGFTQLAAAQPLPEVLLWGKNEGTSSSEGFRPTHLGPCETYCDDVLVQKNDECATAYNKAGNKGSAEVPIEVAKCAGAKQLTFYWLATQANDEGGFQVYANCVALSGSNSGGGGGAGNATAPAETPAPAAGDAEGDAPAPVKPNPSTDDNETTATPKTKKPKKSKKAKKTKAPEASNDGDDDEDC